MILEPIDEDALSADELRQIDRLCLDLEKRLRAGERPDLNEYVNAMPHSLHTAARHYLQQLDDEFASADCAETADAPVFSVTLKVVVGPHRGRQFRFVKHDSFIVGRAACSHFRLPKKDPYFSRVHFLVETNPPACRLVDLDSLNGTLVNGEQVDEKDLRDGDYIQGGDTLIQVTVEEREAAGRPISGSTPMPPKPAKSIPQVPHPCGVDGAGAEIPGYVMVKELGRGGLGAVYLAQRVEDGTHVAVKIITPPQEPGDAEVQRFLREAQILFELDHPHIVRFQQFGRHQDLLYIVMDFVSGVDGKKLVERSGPLGIPRAARLMVQALDALDYAHRRGYVHRDVKPGNLLITDGAPERCRLVDFGLGRIYLESRMSGLTMLGSIGGTPAFMAPEQITNFRGAQPAADQFGAAATFYYLVTGNLMYPPMPDRGGKQFMNILMTEPTPIQQHLPEIPPALTIAVHRALAKDPGQRFSNVREFRDILMRYAD